MSRKQSAKGEYYGEKAFNIKSAYPGKKKKLRQKKKKCPELDIVMSAAELAVHLITFKPMSWYYKL